MGAGPPCGSKDVGCVGESEVALLGGGVSKGDEGDAIGSGDVPQPAGFGGDVDGGLVLLHLQLEMLEDTGEEDEELHHSQAFTEAHAFPYKTMAVSVSYQ